MASISDSIALIGLILGFSFLYIVKYDSLNPKTKRFMWVLGLLILLYVVFTYADDFVIDVKNFIAAINA
jgi:hypothetical protein